MLKDYNMSVLYHPNKDNVAADALSHLSMDSVSHVNEAKIYLVKDVHRLARLGVSLKILRMVVLWSPVSPSHL